MRPFGENAAKHPSSALTVFLGVGVTCCAYSNHSLAQVPVMALSDIPMPSHKLGSCLWSLLAAASRVQSRQPHGPANHRYRETWSPGAIMSEIPGKGFPAFPLILFIHYFLHQCSLFTPYCIWQSQEERRRREKQHRVCRGENRGVIVNVCCPWLVAQLLCGMWDSLLPALPGCCAAGSGGCCGKGLDPEEFHCWQQSPHRATGPVEPGCAPLRSKMDPINN